MPSPSAMLRSLWQFMRSYNGQGTIAYSYAYIMLGLVIASLGPTLTHLSDQTGAPLADLGFLFPCRSVLYVIGSAIGGPIFDRFPGHRVLAVSMLGAAIGTAIIPFCPNIYMLAAFASFQGFCSGILDTGGNVSLVWMWGDAVAPYMQMIHFAFGLGAFMCPLFVEISLEITGSYKASFWFFALMFVPIVAAFAYLPSPKPAAASKERIVRKRTKFEVGLIVIGAFILALYVGAEVSMGGYIYSYFVELLGQSGSDGDFLTSAFWGSLAFARLIAIPISVYVSARTMLIVNMVFAAISSTLMWIFTGNVTMVWVCTIIFGLSMGSTYPSTLNMLEKYVNLSGKITSVLVVGGAIGEMLVPMLLAILLQSGVSWSILMTVLSLDSIINLALLGVFIYVGKFVIASGYSQMDDANSNGFPLSEVNSRADLVNSQSVADGGEEQDLHGVDDDETGAVAVNVNDDDAETNQHDMNDEENLLSANGYNPVAFEEGTGLPLSYGSKSRSRHSSNWSIQ